VTPGRWAWAEVDLDAVRHNVGVLRAAVAPAALWAVVKADGYGHGAAAVARAALEAGAEGLAVALVQEGVALREAGLDATILVLSEQPAADAPVIVEHGLVPTVYTPAGIDAVADAAGARMKFRYPVQLKVDTGMHRAGCAPGDAVEMARRISGRAQIALAGTYTHLAVADEPDDPFTADQLRRFDEVVSAIADAGMRPGLVHAANSAGGLAHPAARLSLVRAGIALYGLSPGHGVDHLCAELRPALSLRARVSLVKPVAAGERVSYGLRYRFEHDTVVATVPIGYADGVTRRLHAVGGEVLVGGHRRPIVGVVTMDQLMVDCGADSAVAVGEEVVLLGRQAADEITAAEWADRLGTISYEVVCGIGARVPRLPTEGAGAGR
jgi:alanine racemase